jgi:hypothetical protein
VSAHVASVVGIARAGSNKGQIGGAGALHAPERFERYIQEGLAWVPFYNGDTDIRGPTNSGPSSTGRIAGHQRFMNAHEDNRLLPVETDRGPRDAGASLLVRLIMGRWTLKLLAELSGGGRRYHDLHGALGGSHTRSSPTRFDEPKETDWSRATWTPGGLKPRPFTASPISAVRSMDRLPRSTDGPPRTGMRSKQPASTGTSAVNSPKRMPSRALHLASVGTLT